MMVRIEQNAVEGNIVFILLFVTSSKIVFDLQIAIYVYVLLVYSCCHIDLHILYTH